MSLNCSVIIIFFIYIMGIDQRCAVELFLQTTNFPENPWIIQNTNVYDWISTLDMVKKSAIPKLFLNVFAFIYLLHFPKLG